jgi:hypothetical protein
MIQHLILPPPSRSFILRYFILFQTRVNSFIFDSNRVTVFYCIAFEFYVHRQSLCFIENRREFDR